jgi:hypothetical protein
MSVFIGRVFEEITDINFLELKNEWSNDKHFEGEKENPRSQYSKSIGME